MENIHSIFEKYNKVIAWGVGNYFEKYHTLLSREITYAIDKNTCLHGTTKVGIPVKPLEALKQEPKKEECLVVVFNAKFDEVFEEARELGVFDIIDIKMIEILSEHICKLDYGICDYKEESLPVLVCASVYALWETNGSRKFIDLQNEVLHKNGIHTLEIAPLQYYQGCNRRDIYMAVSMDKKRMNIITLSEFLHKYTVVNAMIIHSLHCDYEVLGALLHSICVNNNILYYLHDYYCICNYRFLYYQDRACLDSNVLCCFGCENKSRQEEIRRYHRNLFEEYRIRLIAPSQRTALLVGQIYKDFDITVIPHLSYCVEKVGKKRKETVRIAYIGGANWAKGWNDYTCIFRQLKGKYEFYCLGTCSKDSRVDGITYVDVDIKGDGQKLNMVEALRAYNIDIAYLGSVWPETFSYTYYEAFEAGCFVITNERSGNICDQVKANQNGIILGNVDEVVQWLANTGRICDVVVKMNQKIANVQADETFMSYLF